MNLVKWRSLVSVPPMRCILFYMLLVSVLGICLIGNGVAGEASINSQAGKDDARAAFSRQASQASAPVGVVPSIVGCYMWNGRADETYRPFFQWEFRLRCGSAALENAQIRILVLDSQQKTVMTGPWKALGSFIAKRAYDCDYRLNCPNPSAYRIEVTWQGGNESWLGWDRASLPVALSGIKDQPFLICIGSNAEPDAKYDTTLVNWSLWNIGDKAVPSGANVAIKFFNDQGKVIYTEIWNQPKEMVITPHSAKEQFVVVRKKIPHAALSLIANTASDGSEISGPEVNANGVVVSGLVFKDLVLRGHVKNATDQDLQHLIITLKLLDDHDRHIATLRLPSLDIPHGLSKPIATRLSKAITWSSYDVSWESDPIMSTAPTASESLGGASNEGVAAQGNDIPPLIVKGLELSHISVTPSATGIMVHGQLRNVSGQRLENILLSFIVTGSSATRPVAIDIDELDKNQTMGLHFSAKALDRLKGLDLTWLSGHQEPH